MLCNFPPTNCIHCRQLPRSIQKSFESIPLSNYPPVTTSSTGLSSKWRWPSSTPALRVDLMQYKITRSIDTDRYHTTLYRTHSLLHNPLLHSLTCVSDLPSMSACPCILAPLKQSSASRPHKGSSNKSKIVIKCCSSWLAWPSFYSLIVFTIKNVNLIDTLHILRPRSSCFWALCLKLKSL